MVDLFKFRISERIYLLEYKDNKDLASSLLRFQEFYESPWFQGKFFSLSQYKALYIKKFGRFTYYKDWDGFDIPGWVLKPFYAGRFNPLTKKEKLILALFKKEKSKFYIIGVSLKKNLHKFKEEIRHELAHAMFYTDRAFKRGILACLGKYDLTSMKVAVKKDIDYASRVIPDELQAYIIADPEDLKCRIPKRLKSGLDAIYAKHAKRINLEIIG